MVKVVKRDKSLEGYKSAKIVMACKRAGVPEPIAKTIASMVTKKVKNKKTVTSMAIKTMVFELFDKVAKAPKSWMSYKKKK
ncbi:MAG: hypothetical protein WC307_03335 [Candidatus Nanoarchaeia archaeon]|jgi:transcriptional regulator NrdR family protein